MACSPSSNLGILLVEDDDNDRALFEIALDLSGLNIWLRSVQSCQEAIQYLVGTHPSFQHSLPPLPDVIVLDVKMPGVNGFDFLAWRKASGSFSSIPVVVFSGDKLGQDTAKAKEMGADWCLAKPIGVREYETAVRQIGRFALSAHPRAQRSVEPGVSGVSEASDPPRGA